MNTERALEAIIKLSTDQHHLLGLVCIGQSPQIKDLPNWEEDLTFLMRAELVTSYRKGNGELVIEYTIQVHIAWTEWCDRQIKIL